MALVLFAGPALAGPLRVATFHTDLSRKGPGLLLRDILSGKDPQVRAVVGVIAWAKPDMILLTGMDQDHDLRALTALADALGDVGAGYPHRFALPSNRGMRTGLDLDGDGRLGGLEDAQGYGRFTGDGAMAILSRLPIDLNGVRDFSEMLWRDLPGALVTAAGPPEQRLSSAGH
ncbi:MAG: endonuclease/exonuclease/phosphatase family protein, partial [Gemmobacter sp.]|nr:endonuclease/exonuclease/phosphatase family protein [Gemmobacter sp.]